MDWRCERNVTEGKGLDKDGIRVKEKKRVKTEWVRKTMMDDVFGGDKGENAG